MRQKNPSYSRDKVGRECALFMVLFINIFKYIVIFFEKKDSFNGFSAFNPLHSLPYLGKKPSLRQSSAATPPSIVRSCSRHGRRLSRWGSSSFRRVAGRNLGFFFFSEWLFHLHLFVLEAIQQSGRADSAWAMEDAESNRSPDEPAEGSQSSEVF